VGIAEEGGRAEATGATVGIAEEGGGSWAGAAWADEGGLRAGWVRACVQVFERVARNALSAVMEGINSTLFAYGQTGSGALPCLQANVRAGMDGSLAENATLPGAGLAGCGSECPNRYICGAKQQELPPPVHWTRGAWSAAKRDTQHLHGRGSCTASHPVAQQERPPRIVLGLGTRTLRVYESRRAMSGVMGAVSAC
jgi:hypothetical protein